MVTGCRTGVRRRHNAQVLQRGTPSAREESENLPKLVAFATAGMAAALMRGKAYLSIGGVSMGIVGSMVKEASAVGNLFRRGSPTQERS